jgi:hypothetical protein
MNGVISYPIPPYSNVPIEPQYYKPNNFVISAIALGPTTTVTTTLDMNFVIGQEVRLVIPPLCGSRLINGLTGYVISIPASNQVEINLYSVGADPFKTTSIGSQPQIIPLGDINNGYIKPNGQGYIFPTIPGAFKNISPN